MPKLHSKKKIHRSFKRSYSEDYRLIDNLSSLTSHAIKTFSLIFKNWKIFLPFLILNILLIALFIGLMSEATYKGIQDAIKQTNDKLDIGKIGNIGKSALLLIGTITSGGLPSSIGESEQLFFLFIIMTIWLIAIYLARHILAGHKIRMRDGLYNALSPAISTLCILCIIIFELIPIFIVIITYSSALATDFLATPFYALVYFIFASLMILLSLYLLPGGIMALVAISAPGLYPVVAMNTANDLIIGRRIKFIIRLVFMCITLAIFWIVIMLPIILLDLWLKASFPWLSGVPLVPICLLTLTIFSLIYFAIYCYLFYRELLELE